MSENYQRDNNHTKSGSASSLVPISLALIEANDTGGIIAKKFEEINADLLARPGLKAPRVLVIKVKIASNQLGNGSIQPVCTPFASVTLPPFEGDNMLCYMRDGKIKVDPRDTTGEPLFGDLE